MISDQHLIELAKRYVALSNVRDLAQIQTMFAVDSTYHSAFFGEYIGRQAIHAMMCDFFERFRDAYWTVNEYYSIAENGVAFEFVMTGTNSVSGESVKRLGKEEIYFDTNGLISRIKVYPKI